MRSDTVCAGLLRRVKLSGFGKDSIGDEYAEDLHDASPRPDYCLWREE